MKVLVAVKRAIDPNVKARVKGDGSGVDLNGVRFVSEQLTVSERPDLSSARVVVSGGRGMQSKANFALIERVADKLGGAVGASRAAVDAGFAPTTCKSGRRGK
ncbi:electron transfer flavoprotein alpha subunit [Pseudomonas sp. BT76 TE3572]